MTNTNPLTDRLQREARERLIPLLNEHGMGIYTGRPELFDLQAEIIAHTFKETLTAVEETAKRALERKFDWCSNEDYHTCNYTKHKSQAFTNGYAHAQLVVSEAFSETNN